jgi:ketosteroid isomerase-like protein
MNKRMLHFCRFTRPLMLSGILACSGESRDTPRRDSTDARAEVRAVLDSFARMISARDAAAIAHLMSSDSSVVYVSDGRPIRGFELKNVLEHFYAGERKIDFRWDSISLAPATIDVWSATAWAQIGLTDTAGAVTIEPAIFTWTLVRDGGRWHAAMAHKTTLSSQ